MDEDGITRSGWLHDGIRFHLTYRRGARLDDKQGWLDWSRVGKEAAFAHPPSVRVTFTGNIDCLLQAGCIDDSMWRTMQRGLGAKNRGHCGRDVKRQEWSRARRPTQADPDRIVLRRRAPAPDNQWPFYLPAITELLRADVLREFRRKEAEKAKSREQLERILALTPEETRYLIRQLRANDWDRCKKSQRFLEALEAKADAEERTQP